MKFLQKLTGILSRYLGRSPDVPENAGVMASSKVNTLLPGELEKIVTQEEYVWILTETLEQLSSARELVRLERGILFYTQNEERDESQLNFTNLVKYLVYEDRPEWPHKISAYIKRLRVDRSVLDPILESFETARGFLTVRLHTKSMYDDFPGGTEGFLIKEAMGEMYAALALDLPEQFHILRQTEVEKWDIEMDELFWTAYANLGDKLECDPAQIKVTHRDVEGFSLVTLFDRDYSAAFAIDFGNHCSAWIGKIGSIVAIPTRGSVFIHPIDTPVSFNTAFSKIADLTNRFFMKDPGPLTNNIYWFHHNRFELFPKQIEGHALTYHIPSRLLAYLKTPLFPAAPTSDLRDALLTGTWEGFFEYGKGYETGLTGVKRAFQLTLVSKGGQLDGSCTDDELEDPVPIWGFVHKEMISFIKKTTHDIHYMGVYDARDRSFTGTWEIDAGKGKTSSGSWVMIKL
jgi:hypothetical protein